MGCGIYDVKTAAEFGQAVAIARGTPQKPLVGQKTCSTRKSSTPRRSTGIGNQTGMTGREAVELLLAVPSKNG